MYVYSYVAIIACTYVHYVLNNICSIFPSVMHHRRAASDTSMFKRVGIADFKKDSSSTHSSRSGTPLVTSLLKLGGMQCIVCGNVQHVITSTMKVPVSYFLPL